MNFFNNFKALALSLGLGLIINTASASLLIEPHLAVNLSGSGDATYSGVKHEYDYSGPEYGVRLGYQSLGFMGGLDLTRSSFDLEDKTSAGTAKTSYDRNEWGLFVGYNFPILIRAWGTYYFSNTTEASNGNELSGNTTELGVGFTGFPFLSINLMYRMVSYDEQKIGAVTTAKNPTMDINEIVLGVSLPFNL